MVIDFKARLAEIDKSMRKLLADPEHATRCARIEESIAADAKVQREHRRKAAGIPADYREHLDEPRDEKPLLFVREWLASAKPFCIMSGSLGVGKTFAACWVVDQRGGQYANAFDLCRTGMYGEDHWDDLRLAPYLALDELGPEPKDDKGYWEAKLFRLLAGRLDDKRRTLITTNLSRADLKDRYGSEAMARLWDRLETNWMGRVFTGPSLRKGTP